MKDLTPQQEAARLMLYYYDDYEHKGMYLSREKSVRAAKFTAQQIADNTTGATKIFYLEVIKEIEKL